MKLLHTGLTLTFYLFVLAPVDGFATKSISPEPRAYLISLIERSKQNGLADKRTWRVLLHYRKNLFDSGVTSEIDDPEFFLAKTGKTDPEAELEATLTRFFSSKKIGKEYLSPQCAFPARYHWLNSQLQFDLILMPVKRCETVELWRERLNANSVSLVFSSYYLNNPASMFGHTLLRFNSADDAKPSLLDFAISYAAILDNSEGFFDYVWNGLTGSFKGRFSVFPYYDMVKQYNDLENRDLWEYQLTLSPAQIDFMLLHVWELTRTHFDFYFMRENCSYHLLSLLEVADPELQLRDQYWAWTLPTETIKQISSRAELFDDVIRRPSLGTQLKQRLVEMDDQERRYVKQLIDKPEAAGSPGFNLLTMERRARVIDAAISFIQYKSAADRKNDDDRKSKMHALLVQRSQLPVGSIDVQESTMPRSVSPDRGHDPVRFEISGGSFQPDDEIVGIGNESFIELSMQPGFHDLLSSADGHAPNSQINFLNLRARYESESEKWQLQNFTLLDIISLYPLSDLLQEPSWKISVGWEHNKDNGCTDCTPFIFNPGVGVTLQSNFHRREVYFGFLEANLEFDHEFDSGHRAGFGATVGLLFDATKKWRLALIANRARYTEGQRSYVSEVELRQRFTLSRNSEVTFDFKTVQDYREGMFSFAYYF